MNGKRDSGVKLSDITNGPRHNLRVACRDGNGVGLPRELPVGKGQKVICGNVPPPVFLRQYNEIGSWRCSIPDTRAACWPLCELTEADVMMQDLL